MAFHLEVSRSFHRARLFNLDETALNRVLEPWARGTTVDVGEREWDPAESSLTVLEGRALEPHELAMGQGWSNAGRVSRDVSAERIGRPRPESAAVAVLAASASARAPIELLLDELGARAVEWTDVRARILERGAAPATGVSAAVVVVEELAAEHAFEVGVAVGALGSRAILLQLGTARLPAELAALGPIRIDEGRPEWRQALAERLRLAGFEK